MKIALIGGSWSTNIGNAFFNIGAIKLLEKLEVGEVFFVPETPLWKNRELPHSSFELIGKLDVDLVILNGPCLNRRLTTIYANTFFELTQRNIPIGILSAGMSEYTDSEAQEVSDFLNQFNLTFIATRDTETYNFFNNRVKNCSIIDGICTSMYLNEAVRVPKLITSKYVVYNFDNNEEPLINIANDKVIVEKRRKTLFKRQSLPQQLSDYAIIRISNNAIDDSLESIYYTQNTYHSDLPNGYISIISGAEYTFSERVHTCAVSLIMGGKALFIPTSPRSFDNRSKLFERIGAKDIKEYPVSIDMDYIKGEKAKLESLLKKVICPI
jgi:hypothetical protein